MIPTRAQRVEFLRKVRLWLDPDGRFLLSFCIGEHPLAGKRDRLFPIHKVLAYFTLGNTGVGRGDYIMGDGEFCHNFASYGEVISEVKEVGFGIDKSGKEIGYLFLRP